MSETSTLISYSGKISRAELARVPTSPATPTHIPIPHIEVVQTLVETLSLRHIGVVGEEFAVSGDGMEMFGVFDLETTFEGCRFAIGIRNANNKRFRLCCTVGIRVLVCENLAFHGDYTPVLAKHTKNFGLQDSISIGVDRMQRNFEPMRQQVEAWRARQLSDEAAKLVIYRAFIEGDLEVPSTWPESCTAATLALSMRSSRRGPCGACRTRSPRRSRNWKRFRSSGRRPSLERFWKVCRRCRVASPGGKIHDKFPGCRAVA